jgi:hypothetical protein
MVRELARQEVLRLNKEQKSGRTIARRTTTTADDVYDDLVAVLGVGPAMKAMTTQRVSLLREIIRKKGLKLHDGKIYQVNKVNARASSVCGCGVVAVSGGTNSVLVL